ncbi:hypothetical protein AXF42_Ash006206 [Apostasia shenzhenica]|uniref:Uncharacterized protein n=1 Tax=Apostasia shenzhenica TaxID=1088818 RepID=A0A2I0B0L3_9ASPA|nr:hypothetical protein AXF42_Ash006206 [Apostasia shenzhenica]
MESAAEDNTTAELSHEALHRALGKRRISKTITNDDDSEHAEQEQSREREKNRLISLQVNSMEKDAHATCSTKCAAKEEAMEDFARELRIVKRQNRITHCLLAVMIVVTGVWQMSEVALLLAAKEKISHPLRAVGGMLKNSIKRGKMPEIIEGATLPPIAVPQLPHADLPSLSLNGEE